ncbi:zinc fingers and homeoboxes protein 1-like [Anguilla rostrata]|uniref:zinc fingers and homeoboxes protein 1-like n=1 Tax=Anguilla rostrata TaxID=7938 RepID=UPI0030CC7AA8
MASRRKSTTPCMVIPSDTMEQDPDMEVTEGEDGAENAAEAPLESATIPAENEPDDDDTRDVERYVKSMASRMVEGEYKCAHCSYQTPELNAFTFHVDSEHPNVALNSSYICVECNFLTKQYDALLEHNAHHHPGEDGFARVIARHGGRTVSDQASDAPFNGDSVQQEAGASEDVAVHGISLSKTPIMKMKSRAEAKRIAVSHKVADEGEARAEGEEAVPLAMPTPAEAAVASLPVEPAKPSVIVSNPNPVLAESKKATVNPATMLPAGLAQILSALQAHQNAQTQLLIPVSSIPTYNGAMDNNALLISTYNKFPYPSASEISGLAAQTKYGEEQIKIWFSAQRLKHGVSWTPEEVEDARRKQFNGTVHTVPQTITVIPAHLSAEANGLQSILQTCQIMGQPGLVLTQVGSPSSFPVTTPITLAVAGVPGQVAPPKPAASQPASATVETKRATTIQPPTLTPQENSALSADHFGLRPKKSKEQLAELKASYLKNHFASDAEIARLMKLTNLTKGEIKKWFSDTRYNQRNSKNSHIIVFNEGPSSGNSSTIVIDSSDETAEPVPQAPVPMKEKETRNKSWNPFPDFTLQKFKEKTPEQLVVLEESFQKCDTPTDEELNRLRTETKLTRRETDAWFTEKRKSMAELAELRSERMYNEATKSPSTSRQGARAQTPPGGRRGSKDKFGKKTPEQLHVLKNAFVRTQWPSTEEYDQLAEESGLPRSYIVNWFGDSRYAWKNGNLKWFFYYQSGNAGAMNGSGNKKRGRARTRSKGRGRSWGRRAKKSALGRGKSPPTMKFKSGKEILKEYYLKYKFLNEQDLDELVAKSNMGYEQVREWFAEVHRREDAGVTLFDDTAENEEEEEESPGESEMVAEEQGDGIGDEDDEEGESDDSDSWEPPQSVRRTLAVSEA